MGIRTPRRTAVLQGVAETAVSAQTDRVVRVGVDGVDGAGKTVFGDELAERVEALGRPAVRASVDDFHNPRHVRHHRGRASPEGFFLDSYDYDSLREALLDPLSPGGDGRYRTAVFDHESDQPVEETWARAPVDAVLIVDGIFLHRPELLGYWDHSAFLHVDFEVSIPRGAQRGYGDADPLAPSNRRYVEGQRLYFELCRPTEHASVVIDNNDLAEPRIIRGRPPVRA
ncbi:uridine kinase [Saccharopolyspora flava]|uniref:Uridine kinase n=1 Tax=Saccharopolyspora flava TaxID=95161 RepID=A0A1I6SAP8_9PSEU|nr:uridine kinase [Saccharopolyspora flava]SFS73993.1 uridine kinase [Saccharopolyspora flava]